MNEFTGSYRADDATFLLKPIAADFVDLATRKTLFKVDRDITAK